MPLVRKAADGERNDDHVENKRQHAVSHQGQDMAALKTIFNVSHATISNWLTAWETKCIVGLRNQAGQGRKAILVSTDFALIKAKVQLNPQHLKLVRTELKAELAKEFSEKTLKRFLKSLPGRRAVRPLGDGGASA
ncbi:helix-turn-helix domain-containing protein [Spirosoma spitsbergense]|uniref:helix-turn-helix domain-containing protein n=1 Tax=Spirosoma spitsbergense TaxID=431554 RepID=UPI00035CE104|nr:helix-turn-helix domain-containing protein [Spirosoma spitsbergense]